MQLSDTEPSREATEQDKETRAAAIQAFALGLLESRKEAIEGRVASGVCAGGALRKAAAAGCPWVVSQPFGIGNGCPADTAAGGSLKLCCYGRIKVNNW